MNKLTKITIYLSVLVAFAGCDTVEDSYSVGDRPNDNDILTLSDSHLSFNPEGGSAEIRISSIAKWEISFANNNTNQFSVSQTSGKGSETVTVTCKPNTSQGSYSADLVVSAQNFNMEPIKVSLNQNNATFFIERSPSSESAPEEGGSVTMTAYSSLNWELVVLPHDADGNVGDAEWLTVTPGMSGDGNDGNSPIEYRFVWSPNYSTNDRTIRLQLKPSADINLYNLPVAFDLSQQAGTLPQGVRCVIGKQDVTDVDLTLEYTSRSPVKDCGLHVYVESTAGEVHYSDFRPEDSELSKNGSYKFSLKDLPENSKFRIEPFVENQIGEVSGSSQEILTGIKPENMIYKGVSIVDADNGGISVATDLYSATVSLVVVSDVVPLDPNRIANATMSVDGKIIAGIPETIENGKWRYQFTITDLQPNHEYQYSIEIQGKDLPRSLGIVENNTASITGKFKTKGLIPDEDNNERPPVESK